MEAQIADIKTVKIGADLSKVVDRVAKQYDDPVIAFQKEAIQNSWDVRQNKKSGENWRINFYEFKDKAGTVHLVIEDQGTKGMNNERWEGFSSLWRPKKDLDDVGGKGQGKFVLMNASSEHKLLIESISQDNGYICKFLQDDNKSLDDQNLEITNLIPGTTPLNIQGTRIWVHGIKDAFLDEMHSEEFIEHIIESWWQILGPRFSAKISVFGKAVVFNALPAPSEEVILFENQPVANYGRVKRLHMGFYTEKVPSAFDGIMVQRANMTILKTPFEVYSKDYRGRFSGYIEFDEKLEEALKEIEKNDHCGFQSESPWKQIKQLIKDEASKFVSKIVPSRGTDSTIAIRNLSAAIQKANQIINEYCPEVIGEGTGMPPLPPRPKLPLRIKSLSLNKRELKWDEMVKAKCSILNSTNEDKKISLEVTIKRLSTKVLSEEYSLKLRAGESKRLKLTEIILDKSVYEKGKYTVRAILREGRTDIDSRSSSFYLETNREPIKKGFIKRVEFYFSDEPIRNKEINKGVLEINLDHSDFLNIRDAFSVHPNIQNKQIIFYIIKICCDEASRVLLKSRLNSDGNKDIDGIVLEIKELQDRMYYDVIT